MLNKLIKGLIIAVLIMALAYVGLIVYANIANKPQKPISEKMPEVEKAPYSILIKNTNGVILTANYEVIGEAPGQRQYFIRGYWEVIGNDFRYNAGDLVLPEAIFGEITIKKRTVK